MCACRKKYLVAKKLWSTKIWCPKNVGPIDKKVKKIGVKTLGQKYNFAKNNCDLNIISSKKNGGSKTMLIQKNVGSQKNFRSRKILGPKIILGSKNIWSKKSQSKL